jgi:hypothetical protein
MYNSHFDVDLRFGQVTEGLVKMMLSKDSDLLIEVKTDRLAIKTGNIAIEYECRGKPSGIAATKADWWAIQYTDGAILFIKTERLKEICRRLYKTSANKSGGDDNASKMILVPLKELLHP